MGIETRSQEKPLIGHKIHCRELRLKGDYLLTWYACPKCGMERWTRFKDKVCFKCGRLSAALKMVERKRNWKGGRIIDSRGYILVYEPMDSSYTPMFRTRSTKSGSYVAEHRLIMAKCLGRCLRDDEIVHHRNGNKSDNRLENLYLTDCHHHKLGFGQAYQDGYDAGYKRGYEDALKGVKV